jgi:hypothetical protein
MKSIMDGGGGSPPPPPPPPSLLGKQSQSGNIRFTVGQYWWLIIKINGTNSVNFVGTDTVNFVGNMLSNRNFSMLHLCIIIYFNVALVYMDAFIPM